MSIFLVHSEGLLIAEAWRPAAQLLQRCNALQLWVACLLKGCCGIVAACSACYCTTAMHSRTLSQVMSMATWRGLTELWVSCFAKGSMSCHAQTCEEADGGGDGLAGPSCTCVAREFKKFNNY